MCSITLILLLIPLAPSSVYAGNNIIQIGDPSPKLEIEQIYAHFYDYLASRAQERVVDINGPVDAFIEQFRKDIVTYRGNWVRLPSLLATLKDFFLPLEAEALDWIASGGETLYRNGPATMGLTQPDENLEINIPLALWNGTVTNGSVEVRLWGIEIVSTLEGDLADSTYHLQITLYSEFILPRFTQLLVKDRGFVRVTVGGLTGVVEWIFALGIISVFVLLLFIVVSILLYYYVAKTKRMGKEIETYKKLTKERNLED